LQAALEAKGRGQWVAEETATYEDPALYRTDPALAWKRLKGLNRLRAPEQAAARALAEWRERRAVESDKPRGWILADEALYALAVRAPETTADLEQVEALPAGVVRKRGDELLALLRDARADPPPAIEPPRRPTAEEQARASQLLQLVRERAAAAGIGAEVVATRRDVEAIAFGSVGVGQSPLSRGWRASVLGDGFGK
jgi:ribonuclease D